VAGGQGVGVLGPVSIIGHAGVSDQLAQVSGRRVAAANPRYSAVFHMP
jgi:hypothetical protein